MKLNEYQEKAAEFAVYDTLDYPLLALGEEVGELQGKVAKYVRKNKMSAHEAVCDASDPVLTDHAQALRESIAKEAGDALWNLANLLEDLNMTLEDVAKANIEKLESRQKRNVICGEGDDR